MNKIQQITQLLQNSDLDGFTVVIHDHDSDIVTAEYKGERSNQDAAAARVNSLLGNEKLQDALVDLMVEVGGGFSSYDPNLPADDIDNPAH